METDPAAALPGLVILVEATIDESASLHTLLVAHHLVSTFDRSDVYLVLCGFRADAGSNRASDHDVRLQAFADELNLTRSWIARDPSSELLSALRNRADRHLDWNAVFAAQGPAALAGALLRWID